MLKTLIKNQLYAVNRGFFENRKNKKRRSNKTAAVFIALYAALMVFLAVFFFGMGYLLSPLLSTGLTWLYFTITFGVALLMGVFGSVFNTYATLYDAKDNDLLLSMPIPVKYVLIARLSTVYLLGALFSGIVFVPAIIAFYVFGNVTVVSAFTPFIAFILLTMIVLSLSCGLGYLVAKISAKLKNKSFITVIISLVFFGAYYFVYAKASTIISALVASGDAVAGKIKTFAYPLYLIGNAAAGNLIHTLILIAAVTLITFGVYKLLEKSFLKIVTFHAGNAKTKKIEKTYKQKSLFNALLWREFKRFTSSATYMLNCGLGTLVALIAAVAVIVKHGELYEICGLIVPYAGDIAPLLASGGTAIISSMTYTAAASVSLEGKAVYVINSLPVATRKVLKAKVLTQIILVLPTALFLVVSLIFALKLSAAAAAGAVISTVVYTVLNAEFGLFINLKFYNLNWINETAAVKSGISVMLALFFGWIYPAALFALYFVVAKVLTVTAYLYMTIAVSLVFDALLYAYLRKKGPAIFQNLKA